jgi:hypothetical protein
MKGRNGGDTEAEKKRSKTKTQRPDPSPSSAYNPITSLINTQSTFPISQPQLTPTSSTGLKASSVLPLPAPPPHPSPLEEAPNCCSSKRLPRKKDPPLMPDWLRSLEELD